MRSTRGNYLIPFSFYLMLLLFRMQNYRHCYRSRYRHSRTYRNIERDKSATAVTDGQGNYKFSVGNGSYIVTPVPDGGGSFSADGQTWFMLETSKQLKQISSRLSDNDVYWTRRL
jgi:hypothetical protein